MPAKGAPDDPRGLRRAGDLVRKATSALRGESAAAPLTPPERAQAPAGQADAPAPSPATPPTPERVRLEPDAPAGHRQPGAQETPSPADGETRTPMASGAKPQAGASDEDPDALARARRLLEEAIARGRPEGGKSPGVRVDKYFGTELPPVCASLGCYLTDDGKRFYCINAACQKHKRRLTKHNRKGNPLKDPLVYFRCPRCDARRIDMHVLSNQYVCRSCRYVWKR